jgi:hypothetical protein
MRIFFIDVVSGYGCDFALFPELSSPAMADHLSEAEVSENWLRHTDPIHKRFKN